MALAKEARIMGASNVILMSEGVKINLESSGWGIGASYNYSSLSAGMDGSGKVNGSVGAGGTGYSRGSSSYDKLPYLTFAFME